MAYNENEVEAMKTKRDLEAGKQIRKIRIMRKMTLKQVADKAGITPQALSQYERGIRQLKVRKAKDIAAALDVSIDAIADPLEGYNVKILTYKVPGNEGKPPEKDKSESLTFTIELDTTFARLAEYYSRLNQLGHMEALKRVEEMTHLPRYQRSDPEQTTGKE